MSHRGVNFTVPVETTTEFTSWGIVLAIGVILFIMGIVFFIYARERPAKVVNHKSGNFFATVTNTTPYSFDVVTSSGIVKLDKKTSQAMTFGFYETTRFMGQTVSGTKMEFATRPTTEFNTLYITEGGLGTTENTNPNVSFVNRSQTDVIFALVSDNGNARFPVSVHAGDTVSGNAVIVGQEWHIVTPQDTQTVKAAKIIRSIPTTITFDGAKLIVQ